MMTDPIADMLTRVRNAQAARKDSLNIPFSKLKKSILDILSREGYLGKIGEKQDGAWKLLTVDLKYENKQPAIRFVRRESKPGRRVYCGVDEIPKVLGGYGIAILSTPKGVMTNREAKAQKIGGELICTIY